MSATPRPRAMAVFIVVALAWIGSQATPAAAHVGSPDTWFEGPAGPYPVRVVVRAPSVVPGQATIDVRVLDGRAQRVTVQPFAWNAGGEGAPPPDVARAVPGDDRLFSVSVWLMVPTSYGVHITVTGDRGEGTAIVPAQAVATRVLPMAPALGWVLAGLGAFLFVGLLTLAGAATREGSLPPGLEPDAAASRRARIVMAVYAVLLALALVGGRAWWNGEDRAHAANLYRPFHATASLAGAGDTPSVRLTIDDPRWRGREWSPLLSDHGKLMHLFLVREDLTAIAHLHPLPADSEHFEARLPPLPAGRYRVYADIVHESGFAQTLTASLDVPAPGATAYSPSDADDSWFAGAVTGASEAAEPMVSLADGSTLTWERGSEPIVEGRDHPLRFRVTARDGTPASLEPYMGMAAHAVVARADSTVFAHLHPIGTFSMASQMALTMRTPADTVAGSLGRRLSREAMSGQAMAGHSMTMTMREPGALPGEFSIPYGFPRSGPYRLWVQVKRAGAVQTAAFDVDVKPAPSALAARN